MASWSACRHRAATAITSAKCCRSARLTARVANREPRSLSFGGIRAARKRKSALKLRRRHTKPIAASLTLITSRRQARRGILADRLGQRPIGKENRGGTHDEIHVATCRRARARTEPALAQNKSVKIGFV